MWIIKISGNATWAQVGQVVAVAKANGFRVEVRELDMAEIDLSDYLRQFHVGDRSNFEAKLQDLRSRGLITLRDLTKISFDEFWQRIWITQNRWHGKLITLMVEYGVAFSDVNPVEFVSDIDKAELSPMVFNALVNHGLDSTVALVHVTAMTLKDRIKNIGQSGISEIKQLLARRDLHLKGE